jgi:2-methylcitrate dehydratase PrpD
MAADRRARDEGLKLAESCRPTLSTRLVQVLDQVRREPLPDPVVQKAKACCIDFLAACFAATGSKAAEIALAAVERMGRENSTLIGCSRQSSMAGAALFNGSIAHAEELDDSHRYVSGLHLAAVVIPAALAVAEHRELDGATFLRAIVCGYEAASRVCRCIDQGHRARGFHSTGTVGPFGSCAAAAAALDLEATQTVHALGIAASTGAGLFAFLDDGATVKHLHTGRAAFDGLMAALLAQAGMTGPGAVFEAREGFFRAYAETWDEEPLRQGFDGRYEISNVYHKLHSACGHSFPAIDAALQLRNEIGDPGRDIASIEIRTYRAAAVLSNKQPRTVQEARFSIPFVVGKALASGRVGRKELTDSCLQDLELRDLVNKISVTEDPDLQARFPKSRAAVMRLKTRDGRELMHSVDSPRGMPDNPISVHEIEDKFVAEAERVVGKERCRRILEKIAGMEAMPSLRELTQELHK